MTRTKKWLIITPIVLFGGCLATYPIEENRISTYCNNIELGSNVIDALGIANGMFGVNVKTLQSEPAAHFIKSSITFKTICFLKSSDGKIIERYFSND